MCSVCEFIDFICKFTQDDAVVNSSNNKFCLNIKEFDGTLIALGKIIAKELEFIIVKLSNDLFRYREIFGIDTLENSHYEFSLQFFKISE
jgi:hypothetical protein